MAQLDEGAAQYAATGTPGKKANEEGRKTFNYFECGKRRVCSLT